jgi:CRP-like cAMP-binding protein
MLPSPLIPSHKPWQPYERDPLRLVSQSYQPGQVLPHGKARGDGMHVVERGLVALSMRHMDGRRQIIFLAGPGDVICRCGEDSIDADAEVLSPSQIRFFRQDMLQQEAALRCQLLEQVRRQHERAMQHVFAIGQREARQRLGWFLASFSPGARELDLPLSRQDIADYLGLTIETVSREFMRLKRRGGIAYGRSGSITILRPDHLQG